MARVSRRSSGKEVAAGDGGVGRAVATALLSSRLLLWGACCGGGGGSSIGEDAREGALLDSTPFRDGSSFSLSSSFVLRTRALSSKGRRLLSRSDEAQKTNRQIDYVMKVRCVGC